MQRRVELVDELESKGGLYDQIVELRRRREEQLGMSAEEPRLVSMRDMAKNAVSEVVRLIEAKEASSLGIEGGATRAMKVHIVLGDMKCVMDFTATTTFGELANMTLAYWGMASKSAFLEDMKGGGIWPVSLRVADNLGTSHMLRLVLAGSVEDSSDVAEPEVVLVHFRLFSDGQVHHSQTLSHEFPPSATPEDLANHICGSLSPDGIDFDLQLTARVRSSSLDEDHGSFGLPFTGATSLTAKGVKDECVVVSLEHTNLLKLNRRHVFQPPLASLPPFS